MHRRDLKRLADPTPTRAERLDELERIAAMLREIADDRSLRAQWKRRRLLAWRDRLYAEVPEPRQSSEPSTEGGTTGRPPGAVPPPRAL